MRQKFYYGEDGDNCSKDNGSKLEDADEDDDNDDGDYDGDEDEEPVTEISEVVSFYSSFTMYNRKLCI